MGGRGVKPTLDTFPWDRFVQGPSGCWLWNGSMSHGQGYGRISDFYVHRMTYEILRADIPEGLHLDHLCRVRRCGNPWHLEPVTPRVNCHRGASPAAVCAAMTACARGHDFTPENTYTTPEGKRQCRACQSQRWAARNVRRKEARRAARSARMAKASPP